MMTPEETGNFIGFAISPLLEPVIRSPKVFGQILFEAPALLTKSEFAFPLYELFADHISREEGLLRITLEDMKRYLGLSRRYAVYADFLKWVLKPSLESVNANTDIQVSYETWKTGRAVGGFLFRIQRRESQTPRVMPIPSTINVLEMLPTSLVPQWSPEEQAFLDRLARHQVSAADAAAALHKHGLDGAREIFGYVRQEVVRRQGTPGEIRNVSAYLVRCFRDGYGRQGAVESAAEPALPARANRAVAVQPAAPADPAASALLKTRTAEALARWACLPDAEQAALEQRFLQEEPVWALRPADSVTRRRAFERWLVQNHQALL